MGDSSVCSGGMVDLDRRRITLPASLTKTSSSRLIPISSRLHAILSMRRRDVNGKERPATAYVFGDSHGRPVGCIKTGWQAACRRAGIVDLHFHDLRRQAASTNWAARLVLPVPAVPETRMLVPR